MRTRPDDLANAGATRWFVTVDDLPARRRSRSETVDDARARLVTALETARLLRDAGLDFVVAPVASLTSELLHPAGERYGVALYPFVDGETHECGPYPTPQERRAVLDRLVTLHRATEFVAETAIVDDLVIPARTTLEDSLSTGSAGWGTGPYANDARRLLARHSRSVGTVLERYDHLVAHLSQRDDRLVITHGEPHRGNTIDTEMGVAIIDWDTALLAQPERDLWSMIDEDPSVAEEYTAATGTDLDEDAVQIYRLWWDLCEIALFVAQFRQPHEDTEDARIAWAGLKRHLDPTRWTAVLQPRR